MIDRLAPARNPTLRNKRRRLSIEELRKVWLSEPAPVSDFDQRNAAFHYAFV